MNGDSRVDSVEKSVRAVVTLGLLALGRDDWSGRFWSKVIPEPMSGCHLWTACLSDEGYGVFKLDGLSVVAHRVAWEQERDPIPPELVLDHLCRTRSCVNVFHLEPVTEAVNVLRGVGMGARNAQKETAPCGHAYDGAPSVGRGLRGRRCLPCQRQRMREWRAARRAA